MPRANIYIRKENEARWAKITDKSKWVNAMLEKSAPNSKVIAEKLEPEQATNRPRLAGMIVNTPDGTQIIKPKKPPVTYTKPIGSA